jgi:ring-1,2-phenylacetyl-CoA epoxidase subunit PaaB
MPVYEIFGRRKWDDPLAHVGAVHAPDHEAALLLVRETHFRHGEGIDYAVVKREELHHLSDHSLLSHTVDQSYRRQEGYSGFREKRQQARRAAQQRGRGELQKRPVPGRA